MYYSEPSLLETLFYIVMLVIGIIMIVKFFGIAKNIRLMREYICKNASYYINKADMERAMGQTAEELDSLKRALFVLGDNMQDSILRKAVKARLSELKNQNK
ncbi:hypothetical protein [Alistipes indistinctus]|jgi:hypothetical protein|uniref:hypothetical protein n=1 Tax=Alistipes indistinctus TaxID=626932 RepID=UPI003AB2643E